MDNPRKHLPPFDFEFIQTGSHIFPLQRGSISSTHANWEYALSPGRVWNENGDGGYTRAAIPFALQHRNANCVHNGVLSFLFKNDGSVSKVAYQIASETCLYFKVDLWGLLPATYNQYLIANAAALKTAYQAEVANRLPVRSLSSIGTYYPGVDAAKLAAPNGTDASHISLVGFVVDGYHYVGGCTTRYGTYPYCEALVVSSYSAAKSAFAGVAMMRLEKKYPGARNAFVSNWVSNCASNGNWNDVTLNNVLDMATGNYGFAMTIDDGAIGGVAQLDTAQLNAALQKTASDRGVAPLTDYYYNNGFWALNARTNLGCSNAAWIPFMSGFGGITVLLLPNDTVYYYFSDNDTYLWMEAAQESAKIRTLCN